MRPVTAVGHRGDPYRVRENTLPSIAAAIERGAGAGDVEIRRAGEGGGGLGVGQLLGAGGGGLGLDVLVLCGGGPVRAPGGAEEGLVE
ncbi:hypothetical protein ACFV2S_13410, partial [Streptomyces sp. NPDC059695]